MYRLVDKKKHIAANILSSERVVHNMYVYLNGRLTKSKYTAAK